MTYVSAPVIDLPYRDGPFLADLLPGVGAHLGWSGASDDPIGLPDSSRYVVVLVDGLGWDLILRGCYAAPYISGILSDAAKIQASVPTTTSASLTSLWTGKRPGEHGVLGFSFEMDARLTIPLFRPDPIPTAEPVMDLMADCGIATSWVIPPEQIGSGLTRMGTRRSQMIPVATDDHAGRVAAVRQASRQWDRSLVYVYEHRLDDTGHHHGVASQSWSEALSHVDSFLEDLRVGLDDDVRLLVTGDHGMVDVPKQDRIDIDLEPQLREGVRLIAGEARFRHLYTDCPAQVVERWQGRVGDKALVLTREESVEAGFFGDLDPAYLSRIGDVVVVSTSTQAYLTSGFPGEYHLVGMHGGYTQAELWVPVLMD